MKTLLEVCVVRGEPATRDLLQERGTASARVFHRRAGRAAFVAKVAQP
jgi:hypothetical protein